MVRTQSQIANKKIPQPLARLARYAGAQMAGRGENPKFLPRPCRIRTYDALRRLALEQHAINAHLEAQFYTGPTRRYSVLQYRQPQRERYR